MGWDGEDDSDDDDDDDDSSSLGGDKRVIALMSGDDVAGRYRHSTALNCLLLVVLA